MSEQMIDFSTLGRHRFETKDVERGWATEGNDTGSVRVCPIRSD